MLREMVFKNLFFVVIFIYLKNGIDAENSLNISTMDKNIEHEFSYLKEFIQVEFAKQEKKIIRELQRNFLQSKKFDNSIKMDVESSRYDENFNCIQKCGPILDLPNSCEEAMSNIYDKNGVYLLYVPYKGLKPFFAYCKRMDNKIWTVIQRREDGSVDFYRYWEEYKNGFGNLYGEFWLGLERIHAMTSKYKYELLVMIEGKNGKSISMQFKIFSIANEDNNYKLKINGANVTGSIIGFGNGQDFSTFDYCHDRLCPAFTMGCPHIFKSAWWFYSCSGFIFNGSYNMTNSNYWPENIEQLKYSQMSIRRV